MLDSLEETTTETINITDEAIETVRELLVDKGVPDYGLRVFVVGGGCSGLQYGMALEAEARPYDHVIEQSGIKVFVDPTSHDWLRRQPDGRRIQDRQSQCRLFLWLRLFV